VSIYSLTCSPIKEHADAYIKFVMLYVKTHNTNSQSFLTATFVMVMDKNVIAAIVAAAS
jgi:hypothetical protein